MQKSHSLHTGGASPAAFSQRPSLCKPKGTDLGTVAPAGALVTWSQERADHKNPGNMRGELMYLPDTFYLTCSSLLETGSHVAQTDLGFVV